MERSDTKASVHYYPLSEYGAKKGFVVVSLKNAKDRNRDDAITMLMGSKVEIVFLGTGGGRFATVTQKRRTAGIRIMNESLNVHLDPGPGALVYSVSEGLDPQKINGVFVSHCHPDHYTDAEVLIEAMTKGTTRKRGVLVASRSTLSGNSACESSISAYHQQMPEQRIEATPGKRFELGDLKISVTAAKHTDPDAVGFRFEAKEFGSFAYTSDTEFFEGIEKHFENVRLLILCVMRPAGRPYKGHMTTDDAVQILEKARPEQAVLTHFGMQMIFRGPAKEAELIQEKTGVPTVAANDGTRTRFAETITVRTRTAAAQQGLNEFF